MMMAAMTDNVEENGDSCHGDTDDGHIHDIFSEND